MSNIEHYTITCNGVSAAEAKRIIEEKLHNNSSVITNVV